MLTTKEQISINDSLLIIQSKAVKSDLLATSSYAVKSYCQLKLALSEREEFGVLFLDNQHHLIDFEIMFKGTINAAAVYPREVAKLALKLNAAAVILTHNHPSGILEASNADKVITDRLVKALSLIDVRVLDHVIVSVKGSMSFSEEGLL